MKNRQESRRYAISLLVLPVLFSACVSTDARFETRPDWNSGSKWLKGNTHTHTTNSDGDSPPDVVARWYYERDYDFLVLTDHNHLTDPSEAGIKGENFLLIPGEEISATWRSPFEKSKPIHINALDPDDLISSVNGQETVAQTVQANIDAIRDADAVPHINHPNFRWAMRHQDLFEAENCNLVEIYNGHPLVNNEGDADHPGMEEVWDILLTGGKKIYGIGVDDAHHFREFAPGKSNPGRCWVMVRSNVLDKDQILESLDTGDFYFTTGVVLDRLTITSASYELVVENGFERVEFIGRGGTVFQTSTSNPAIYKPEGTELYIRARVYGTDGSVAWTQPVFLEDSVHAH